MARTFGQYLAGPERVTDGHRGCYFSAMPGMRARIASISSSSEVPCQSYRGVYRAVP